MTVERIKGCIYTVAVIVFKNITPVYYITCSSAKLRFFKTCISEASRIVLPYSFPISLKSTFQSKALPIYSLILNIPRQHYIPTSSMLHTKKCLYKCMCTYLVGWRRNSDLHLLRCYVMERGNKMDKINKGNEHRLLAVYGNGGSKVPSSIHAWLPVINACSACNNRWASDLLALSQSMGHEL